jgi:hypothetical protein
MVQSLAEILLELATTTIIQGEPLSHWLEHSTENPIGRRQRTGHAATTEVKQEPGRRRAM